MPNGRYILNDLEFDKEIKGKSDRGLMEFTAQLSYSNAIRIISLEKKDKRAFKFASGIGAFSGSAVAAIVSFFIFFLRRG